MTRSRSRCWTHAAVRSRGGRRTTSTPRARTPAEYEIELKLDKPITIEFNQTPLDQAVDNLRTLTGLPIVFDTAALEAEAISAASRSP